MNADKIIYEIKENVAYITLNNPDKLNCIGFEMLHALDNAIDSIETNPDVRLVLLKGAGSRAFSTGADLKEFKSLNSEGVSQWIQFGNAVFNKLEMLKKPTLAFINGYALGGGLELALCCDIRIGTPNTILSNPELKHGWLPGWGGMVRLRKLFGESVAKEVVFLGESIGHEKALQLGLLNRVIESESSEEFEKIAEHLSSLDPMAFSLAKSALADESRTTSGEDVNSDVMATRLLRKDKDQ